MSEHIFLVLAIVLNVYIISSLVVSAYIIFTDTDLNEKPVLGVPFFRNTFFFVGGFMGLIFLLQGGFENILHFVPDNWGDVDEYGEWTSFKESASAFLALVTGICFTVYLAKARRLMMKKSEEEV